MSAAQKHAWFNLAIIGLTLAVVGALVATRGWVGSQGGLGFLGFLGFGAFWYRGGRQEVASDERDHLIRRRSMLVAYTIFWIVCATGCVLLRWYYGATGTVPVVVVQSTGFLGMALICAVQSVVTLVQYGPEGASYAG